MSSQGGSGSKKDTLSKRCIANHGGGTARSHRAEERVHERVTRAEGRREIVDQVDVEEVARKFRMADPITVGIVPLDGSHECFVVSVALPDEVVRRPRDLQLEDYVKVLAGEIDRAIGDWNRFLADASVAAVKGVSDLFGELKQARFANVREEGGAERLGVRVVDVEEAGAQVVAQLVLALDPEVSRREALEDGRDVLQERIGAAVERKATLLAKKLADRLDGAGDKDGADYWWTWAQTRGARVKDSSGAVERGGARALQRPMDVATARMLLETEAGGDSSRRDVVVRGPKFAEAFVRVNAAVEAAGGDEKAGRAKLRQEALRVLEAADPAEAERWRKKLKVEAFKEQGGGGSGRER